MLGYPAEKRVDYLLQFIVVNVGATQDSQKMHGELHSRQNQGSETKGRRPNMLQRHLSKSEQLDPTRVVTAK